MGVNGIVLGVSSSSHDRSAALMRGGELIAAISEERIDRRKKSQGFYGHAPGFLVLPPLAAITYVLNSAEVSLGEVDLVVCGRSITTCRETLLRYLPLDPDRVIEPAVPAHHLAHAYSAYVTAPFDACDVLVIDEQGQRLPNGDFERCTTFSGTSGPLQLERRFLGSGNTLSLGMYFDVFAALASLSEAGLPAAGKLMALAASGSEHRDWPQLITPDDSGDVVIDIAAVDYFLENTAGMPVQEGYRQWHVRQLEDLRLKYLPVHWGTRLAADLARKAQDELETALLHIAGSLRARTGAKYLAYAGGVALNCTANARLRETGYADVFVHPAATDDGAAVGLAAYGWIEKLGSPRRPAPRFSARLGRTYPPAAADAALARYRLLPYVQPAHADEVARLITNGCLVARCVGRSEWGPRALGSRSILADPTQSGVVERLNARVKYREPFRPFGISVAEHAAAQLLQLKDAPVSLGPYMLAVAPVRDERLAGVAHRDGTIRYQIVGPADGDYHELLLALERRHGVAAVLNTSFNTMGEPLVESPDDAVRQFLLCGADALVLDGRLLHTTDIPADVLEPARDAGWEDSRTDPLRTALQLEAAGYRDAAARMAARCRPCLSLGPERNRDRAALLMRLAVHDGDQKAAIRHAEEVMRWSGFPAAAADAAAYLASLNGGQDLLSADATQLLAAVAPRGRSISVLKSVFGEH